MRPPPTAVAAGAPQEPQEEIHPEIARIMEESARQAILEVDLEMRAAGETWTQDQTFARQQLRTIELFMPRSNAYIASINEDGWREDVLDGFEATRDALRRVENKPVPKTTLDQVVDSARRHPVLTGWFGAQLLHKLRRR
jgi:hypothetical protein